MGLGAGPDHTPTNTPFKQLPTEAAYEAVGPELLALGNGPFTPINIDIVSSVMTVLGSLPEIRALRPAIERELPNFDLATFDKLEQYALAVGHAHALYRGAVAPNGGMAALASELTVLRDRMHQCALILAEFGLINGERIKDCKTAIGYRALISDVLTLIAVYKEHWNDVAQKTPVTAAMLDEAGSQAVALLEGVGLKEQAPLTAAEAALQRSRAFTLLTRAYDDVRRAAAYLRSDYGDLEKIAPSLYGGRSGNRGRVNETAAEGAAAAPAPSTSQPDTPSETDAQNIVVDNRAGLPLTPPLTN